MLKQLKYPSVLWSDNAVFTDYSVKALDYSRDNFSLNALSSTQDYFYFGLYKQFTGFYVEIITANAAAQEMDFEFYNGTTWTDLVGDVDETAGFSRSGFVRWNANQTDWSTVTVNSITDKYWIRFRPATTFDATISIRGVNLVYSDDQDLKAEYPEILNFLSSSENSYILRHQSARDDIIQSIRNDGKYKLNYGEGLARQFDVWDLLDVDEVRRWSMFLTLEKIFSNLQSQEGGLFAQKRLEYKEKAAEAGKLFWVSLDHDDDGIVDIEERLGNNFQRARLIRT